MRSFILVLGAGIFTIVPGYAQDAASGEKIFVQCKACHQIGENAKNAVGPVLNGLFGRKAGTIAKIPAPSTRMKRRIRLSPWPNRIMVAQTAATILPIGKHSLVPTRAG